MSEYVCQECGEEFDSSKSRGMHRRWNHTNPWEDKDKLREKYHDEGKSINEIAEEWDCGSTTIEQWLSKHGIETRNPGGDPNAPWKDEDTLDHLYWDERLAMSEIAEELGCSYGDVRYYMEKHEIPRRGDGGIDLDSPWKSEEKLREKYIDEGLTTPEIAEEWGCSPSTISRHMQIFEIEPIHYYTGETYRAQPAYGCIIEEVDGTARAIQVHRLVAYAHGKLDFEGLFDPSVVVHHKDKIEWHNSPDNLEVMAAGEHTRMHNFERWENESGTT